MKPLNITIQLNGQPHLLSDPCSLSALIEALSLNNKKIAVEFNQQIIPRSLWHTTWVNHDDTVEIVHAIGGG